jgi:hypothetical protein
VIPDLQDFTTPTPAEHAELIAYARELLLVESCGGYFPERFLASGKLPSSLELGNRTLGTPRDARRAGYNRQAVCLYRPCEREVETARAWHDYCSEHGYPIGDLCGADERPGSTYPQRPEGDGGTWVGLTWTAIRRELQSEGAPDQLDLLGAAA